MAERQPREVLAQRVNEGIGRGFAATLIFAGWATVIAYESLSSWVDRRLGRR
jgi:hypothetical protein